MYYKLSTEHSEDYAWTKIANRKDIDNVIFVVKRYNSERNHITTIQEDDLYTHFKILPKEIHDEYFVGDASYNDTHRWCKNQFYEHFEPDEEYLDKILEETDF
jgi:hypothetical protein